MNLTPPAPHLQRLVEQATGLGPIRVAVADAAQSEVLETMREAQGLGLVEPRLVGDPEAIAAICSDIEWTPAPDWMVPAGSGIAAAAKAVELAREGKADAVMKGHIHTDSLMHALLDKELGLRVPSERVSHVFLVDVATRSRLLGITDAAINIAPDLSAKAQILQNAINLFQLLGVETPKAAVLSAIETVNPEIVSTLDAACLTLMAQRGQITGALVDGPLAFDNAISSQAAADKGIVSAVAGDADILLVPDLVSGNILAKNLEYLAGATAAGIAVGLAVPVALTSRADPVPARLASLAVAALMHHRRPITPTALHPFEASLHCAPQPERACYPLAK
ncbi:MULTISPECIES: bifunctional enoyl-CoA hydratase/phosphate acetyltransferase [Novosphingobium]|uniref:Bifunctional enoyl-CoA hydratase/phosphate acetyltransferase n=2 Tax=Novosphingobium TaxID=165696 RepID=A0ABT2IBV5_9SPHN|nr:MULTISPECIES: bifunctional enoyl-CoA hydratase/phosphate acetyltransferase [Novosphingobium]MCT2401997.1 bifunctional enoyl-CoA hydratase/phosphate acetyltransferase [Novosphingobium mangrovi (ex Huang et al. 2023)]